MTQSTAVIFAVTGIHARLGHELTTKLDTWKRALSKRGYCYYFKLGRS